MHIRWRGLELPGSVAVDQKTLTPTYGKFVAEPFERGFGTTVGNSLRRVLLSSLEGSAVTQIKVGGALHEFTTIKGVLEDITDVVLAVKSLVVKNHSDSTRVIRVETSTKGPITAADIQTDDAVEVVNAKWRVGKKEADDLIASLRQATAALLEAEKRAFDESQVERWPEGDPRGGQFAPQDGAGGGMAGIITAAGDGYEVGRRCRDRSGAGAAGLSV